MTSLGERLKAQNEARAAAAAEEERRKAEKVDEKARKERRECERFFRDFQEDIVADIEADKPVRVKKIKLMTALYANGKPISVREHPNHEVWLAFKAWLDENGLDVSVVDQHDGVGIESWYELQVKPKV